MIIFSTPRAAGIGPTSFGGAGGSYTYQSLPGVPARIERSLHVPYIPRVGGDGLTVEEGAGAGQDGSLPSYAPAGLPTWWKPAAAIAGLGLVAWYFTRSKT